MALLKQSDWVRVRDVVHYVEGLRGARGPRDGRGVPDALFPFGSIHPFGISDITGSTVTVAAGGIEIGGTYYETTETEITITADGQYIGLEYDRTAGTVTVTGPHASRPVSGADYYRTWLYVFDGNGTTWCDVVRHNLCGLRLVAAV